MKTRLILCFLLTISVGYHVHGQYRSAAFSMDNGQSGQTVSMARTFTTDEDIPLTLPSPVYSFSLSGNATLKDTTNSLIRITLVDNFDMEYLVYEIYPLLTDQWRFDFDNMAFETSGMNGVNVTGIKIRLLNAELTLGGYHYTTEPARSIQRQQRFKSQQQYIIETLNANLEARNMPWRAGETSVSNLSYEEKKNLFGGTVPNLNGFEYYIGGIFVMPDFQPEQKPQAKAGSSLPSEWDWRNRHGKNWMTPVRNQGTCGSCAIFAVVGTLEAYTNLYYNQLLNLDLSEQQLVSCADTGVCNNGIYPKDAFQYIIKNGIINETCFPYQAAEINCNAACNTPNEKVWIDDVIDIEYPRYSVDDIKRFLFRAPICFSLKSWNHSMVLTGYKTIKQGDVIYYYQDKNCYKIDIKKNHAYIGSTAWTLKNSWGANFGDNGYVHVLINMNDMYCTHAIQGNIRSQGRTSNDIVVSNADNDPYSFWGIGSLPGYDPDFADGNDASPQEGPLDAYGHAVPLTPIESLTYWNSDNTIGNTVFIQNGGILNISAIITMNDARNIIVRNGGKLIIDGGTLNNAAIEVESGGQLQIINNGTIKLRNAAALDVKKGGTLDINYGYID